MEPFWNHALRGGKRDPERSGEDRPGGPVFVDDSGQCSQSLVDFAGIRKQGRIGLQPVQPAAGALAIGVE